MNILVTGGASGLGASIVKRLAEKEHVVYFTYSKSVEDAKKMESGYKNTQSFFCDFADSTSVDELLKKLSVLDLDVLINNANGSIHKEHFHKTDPAIFLSSFETNVIPTLRITQEAIILFRKRKSGKIINVISSAVVNKPPVGWSAYVANKAYLLSMSKSWATEGARFNITSNSISPSFMLTNMTADTDERILEQMTKDHPLKKLLTTKEVADAVCFFVTCSSHINGTHLVMNAGVDIIP